MFGNGVVEPVAGVVGGAVLLLPEAEGVLFVLPVDGVLLDEGLVGSAFLVSSLLGFWTVTVGVLGLPDRRRQLHRPAQNNASTIKTVTTKVKIESSQTSHIRSVL